MEELPADLSYPFRGPAARGAVNEVLRSIEPMIRTIAVKKLRKLNLPHLWCIRDDLVNETLWHLTSYSLPRFDPTKGTKVSTFAHYCATNFINSRFRSKKAKAHQEDDGPENRLTKILAPDQFHDRAVERLAHDVLTHPRKYLTAAQARVMELVRDAPVGTTGVELSRLAGFTKPSNLSMILKRIRATLKNISVEDGEVCQTPSVP